MYYTKKHYPFHGLFLLFAGLSLLGCTDEDNSYAPAHPGNAIQFSVERIATRTHYEDKYEENGTVYYPIDWDAGDQIFISSTDAVTSISGKQHAIYSVAPADDASYHGSITAIDPSSDSEGEAYGLHWGMGEDFDKPYTFYGAYPAQRVKGYSNSMDDMTSGTLTMQYYTNQVCKITSVKNGQYESKPDMMNAYMLAKKTLPSPTADHILLDFKPIMTTLDIHITAGNYEVATGIIQPVTVTGVSIITPGELKGKELQCNVQTLDEGTTSLTNFDPSVSSNECVFVGIDNALKSNNEKSFGYVDLFEDESLHLMAFLPPFENVSYGTQIKIHAVGGLSFVFTLKEGQNYFEAQKRIDVQLPDVSPVTTKANDWISQLNDSKLLKTLSIPGYECKKGDESKLNDLLNMGVRAFDMDLMTERSGSVCRFSDSVTQTLKNFLSTNPNEFVIIWIHNSARNLRLNEYLDENFPNQWVSPESMENLTITEAANTPIIVVKKNTSHTYYGEFNRESEDPLSLFSKTVLFTMSDFTNGTLDLSEEWGVHPISDVAMNKSIYEQITSSDKQEGFTGIIMVHNAGEIYADDATYTYSDLLIQSIIDCNYKFH